MPAAGTIPTLYSQPGWSRMGGIGLDPSHAQDGCMYVTRTAPWQPPCPGRANGHGLKGRLGRAGRAGLLAVNCPLPWQWLAVDKYIGT